MSPHKGSTFYPREAEGGGRAQRKSTVNPPSHRFLEKRFFHGSRGISENRPKPSSLPRGKSGRYFRVQKATVPATAAANKRGNSADGLTVLSSSSLRTRLLLVLPVRFPLLSARVLLLSECLLLLSHQLLLLQPLTLALLVAPALTCFFFLLVLATQPPWASGVLRDDGGYSFEVLEVTIHMDILALLGGAPEYCCCF